MRISDQNMWFFLPYIRTELLSSRVQHVSWKPYSYFRSKYVIFPTLYQNWTAVHKSPACVLETLFLFQIKICDFPYPISELNCCPWESSMCPGNLIPISDQNMWFSLPYTVYQNWTAVLESPACVLGTLFLFQIKISDFPYPIIIRSELLTLRVQHVSWEPCPISDQNMWFSLPYTVYQNWTAVLEGPACVRGTLSLFLIKICDFPYPILELNCCPQESSICPGNLIPISDQNMWFSPPYIRTKLLSLRVQHVGTLSLFQTNLHVYKEISHLEFTWLIEFIP